MIVAIHQPNYAPWLGYFAKMARAGVLVFLDDVQYSKNSYINRVQIDAGGEPRWLTVPVSYNFGDPISRVQPSNTGWRRAHLDTLKTHYGRSAQFAPVWRWLCEIYADLSGENLAASNQGLIIAVAARLGLGTSFRLASEYDTGAVTGDERLIAILRGHGSDVTYLSGKGGANYQDPEKFHNAGIVLEYTNFAHPIYDQGHATFLPGLSILDAMFHLGFEQTAALLVPVAATA